LPSFCLFFSSFFFTAGLAGLFTCIGMSLYTARLVQYASLHASAGLFSCISRPLDTDCLGAADARWPSASSSSAIS
jgi:hypothetical protein